MKIRREIKHGNERWILDIGWRGGKRRKKVFSSLADAEAELEAKRKDAMRVGQQWSDIPAAERYEFVKILEEIEDNGLTLREVWDGYKQGRSHEIITSRLIRDTRKEFIQEKENAGRRALYVSQLEHSLKTFGRKFDAHMVNQITVDDLKRFLGTISNVEYRATLQSRIRNFLGWCQEHGWAKENPATKLQRISIDRKAPDIFDVPTCQRLLNVAYYKDVEAFSEIVLMLFQGVRPEEVNRLTARDIDLEHGTVEVSAAASKTRRRRVIEMEQTTIDLLKLCPSMLIQQNRRRRMRAIRDDAGLHNWPKDVLRHTAASHLYAIHGASKTAMILGNSEQVLHQHYRNIVKPKESEAFWGLRNLLE